MYIRYDRMLKIKSGSKFHLQVMRLGGCSLRISKVDTIDS
jgi:hypothetical protein